MEWTILQTIVYIVTFLITVIGFGIKLSNVIQKNTQAINTLTDKLKELTEDNNVLFYLYYIIIICLIINIYKE